MRFRSPSTTTMRPPPVDPPPVGPNYRSVSAFSSTFLLCLPLLLLIKQELLLQLDSPLPLPLQSHFGAPFPLRGTSLPARGHAVSSLY